MHDNCAVAIAVLGMGLFLHVRWQLGQAPGKGMVRLCHQQPSPVVGVGCHVRDVLVLADSSDGEDVLRHLLHLRFQISHICVRGGLDKGGVEEHLR